MGGSTRASALRLLRRASLLKQLADSEEMSFRLCSLMQLDEDRRMGGWKETIGMTGRIFSVID